MSARVRRTAGTRRRAVAIPPDPTQVTGLVRRWRADSLALADGASVTSWPDLVAAAAATGAAGPVYKTGIIGGQPTVRFAGTTSLLSGNVTLGPAFTVITVARMTTHASNSGPVGLDLGSGAARLLQVRYSSTTQAQMIGFFTASGPIITDSQFVTSSILPNVLTAVRGTGPTSAWMFVNGKSDDTGATGTGNTDNAATRGVTIGSATDAANYFTGDIAEVLIYDHALSAPERVKVHSYVQNRYGITVFDYSAT